MPTSKRSCDLLVIGGGPAGLSAAVNAGSEGLKVCLVDSGSRFGGQAGTSTMIENYAGFPEGVTGPDLTNRMLRQADKFGVTMLAPHRMERMWCDGGLVHTEDDDETIFTSKAVILAFGVQYRTLSAHGLPTYLDRGVYYGSPSMRATYDGDQLFVVGGANSAGQAALHLAKSGQQVDLLIRGDSIEKGMSTYLIERIKAAPNMTVHLNTEVNAVYGGDCLEEVELSSLGTIERVPANQLFILIGAKPKTKWLDVARDAKGFVLTGSELCTERRSEFFDTYGRAPLSHETSVQGIFAAGDLRAGSTKRVAGAVGDGAAAVSDVHRYSEMMAI